MRSILLTLGVSSLAASLLVGQSPVEPRLVLQGHRQGATAIAFSPGGQTLASVSLDGMLCLWDVATGARRWCLDHSAELYAVAFSSDGGLLAVAAGDSSVRIWRTESRVLVRQSTLGGRPMSVAWTPRGDLLVGSSDGTVRSIGTDGRKQFEVAAGNEIFNLAVAPDGSTFASSLPVRLWSVADGSRVRGLGQWGQGGVAWAPDGSLLAIADWGAGGLALDPGNGEVRDTLRAPQSTGGQGPSGRVPFEVNMPLTSVAFSGNGDWLAAGGADRKIWLWSVTSGRVGPGDGSREHPMSVTGVAFSPDGRLLASASLDGGIRLWDVPAR